MYSETKSTSEETNEFIGLLPASELFQYNRFTEAQQVNFFKALSLFTSPLLKPEAASGAGKKKSKREDVREKFTLSFHARQTVWSMQHYKLYFLLVVDMLMSRPYDVTKVRLKKTRIYTFDYSGEKPVLSPKLREDISTWWRARDPAPVFAFPMYTTRDTGDHALFVALKKNYETKEIQLLYIDSGGSESVFKDMISFSREVEWLFFKLVTVVPVDVFCPVLQTVEQGGNCVQWQMMFLTLLTINPELFDDFNGLITRLSIEPLHNLLMFQMYMFFYIQSIKPDFYNALMSVERHKKMTEETWWEFDAASGYIRGKLFPIFPVQDCDASHKEEKCNRASTCLYCDGACVNRNVVETEAHRCVVISSTTLYANLADLGTSLL